MKGIKEFNKIADLVGVELIKGKGYFYWGGAAFDLWPSEYIRHFNHASFEFWVKILETNLNLYPLKTGV